MLYSPTLYPSEYNTRSRHFHLFEKKNSNILANNKAEIFWNSGIFVVYQLLVDGTGQLFNIVLSIYVRNSNVARSSISHSSFYYMTDINSSPVNLFFSK